MESARLIRALAAYFGADTRRTGHALKVYALASAIGRLSGFDAHAQEALEAAAVLHDVGIKPSEEKYHSSAGKYQELEGPPAARKILYSLGADEALTARVCWLIAHHHTYGIDGGDDWQALIEADFLVNIAEDGLSVQQVRTIREKNFRTGAGKEFFDAMFPLEE